MTGRCFSGVATQRDPGFHTPVNWQLWQGQAGAAAKQVLSLRADFPEVLQRLSKVCYFKLPTQD